MKRIIKRLTAILLALAMVVTFVPLFGTQTAYAADDRTEIHSVAITSHGLSEYFVNGGSLSWIYFDTDESDPVEVWEKKWEQKVDGNWVHRPGGAFSTGTWRVSLLVRIGGDNGLRYKIGTPFTATVDGVVWNADGEPNVSETDSYKWITSPEMEIEAPSELTIHLDSSYNIGISYVRRAISMKSVSSCPDGGVKPYSFSKQDGPDWLTVDSGGNINGTPLSVGPNKNMVIRVTDSAGASLDFTISVGDTVIDPADRTVITFVTLTTEADLTPAHNDKMLSVLPFSAEEDKPVDVCNLTWMKKDGDKWQVKTGKFSPGIWRLKAQIRIGSVDSTQYVLGEPFTATVNGVEWITDSGVTAEDTYSYVYVLSPEFQIKGDVNYADIKGITDKTYTGKAIIQSPDVKIEGSNLEEGTDYTISYENNTNAGTATVIITGKGNYTGTVEKTFTIAPKKITSAVKLSAAAYTWNGQARKPAVTVKDGSTKLAASDYTVTYKNNKNVGKASAVVTLKGNYSGTKTVTFKINPKGTSLSKVTSAKKAVTVKWKKQSSKMSSSRITGYQIQLATNSKFTKGKKTVNVNGYKTVSKKVTGLKGGKKYYVRIRTCKTVGGKKYYSPWSKVKTVKTKK